MTQSPWGRRRWGVNRRIALFVILVGLAAAGTAGWLLRPASPVSLTTPEPATGPSPAAAAPTERPTNPWQVTSAPADAGPAVTLRVVSAVDDRPLPGASVEVRESLYGIVLHHSPPPLGTAVTDATGTARFFGLPEGELKVSVRLSYFESVFLDFEPDGTVTLEPLLPLRGVVLNADRSRAAGARVTTEDEPMVETAAGADGRFALPWASRGSVVGEKNGALGQGVWLGRDPHSEVEILLGVAPQGNSRVVGRDGSPLEGVEVELRIGSIVQHHLTGGEGDWACPALPGITARLHFAKQGYLPVEEQRFLGRGWQDTVLSRGARLEGWLVNPDHTPVPGATIELTGMAPSLRPPTVTTDGQGRFAFAGLDRPMVEVWASLGEKESHVEVPLPDGQTREVTIVFAPQTVPLELEVVNENGTEVEQWSAVATPVPDPGWTIHREIVGDLALPIGRYRIVVTALDDRTAEVTLDVSAKPDQPPVRVVLAGNGEVEDTRVAQTLQVRVRTPSGEPVEGANVTCLDGSATTGADGTAACRAHTDEESWPVPIIASLGNARGMTRATGKEPLVEVVVRTVRTIRGRVLGQLPASHVRVVYRSSTQSEALELSGNSFALEGVDPVRTFVCVVHDPGYEVLGCAVADTSDDVVITTGAPGALELTVLDEKGQPVNAPIFYVDRERMDEVPIAGVAHLALSPGSHVLVVNLEGRRARYEATFSIKPGEVTRLGTVRLE